MSTIKTTILIIDDTPMNIDVLVGMLSSKHNIKAATNGKIGLKLADKFKPSLILLDIMMPGMNGYEVCKALKEDIGLEDIPVLFVTAMESGFNKSTGLSAGGLDFIHKPIDPVDLDEKVAKYISII